MRLLPRPLALAGVIALGACIGCSHEHGPLSETPDTTSLGNAGRWQAMYVSTATGLTRLPENPEAVVPGTVQGETSPLTTRVQPTPTLYGTRADWTYGQTYEPETGWAMRTWTSGPNLPVEPWNMAMEAASGEGEGHGAAAAHRPGH